MDFSAFTKARSTPKTQASPGKCLHEYLPLLPGARIGRYVSAGNNTYRCFLSQIGE
jgi:hypothetical protein